MVFILFLLLLPPRAVVIASVAEMHSLADQDASVVSQVIYGSPVEVMEDKPGWVRVRTADEYEGWVAAGLLKRLGVEEPSYASSGRVAEIRSLFAHLYREPDVTRHKPLLTVPFETRLEVVEERGGEPQRWLQVRLPDGQSAWVQRGDVSFPSRPLTAREAVALSMRFLNLPYLWGGRSSFGYDCSGFTQMLVRKRGAAMPRDADPQSRWTGSRPVRRRHARPGDLLYFGKRGERVTHTGMYIGGGRFVHASTRGRPVIQISRLRHPHWWRLLVGVRRLKAVARPPGPAAAVAPTRAERRRE